MQKILLNGVDTFKSFTKYKKNASVKVKKSQKIFFSCLQLLCSREDKTIESAVPFPAPEKGVNQELSPFQPRKLL